LGIDFGTSTTVAVLAVPGREPRPLLFDGSPLMPSAVCLDPAGAIMVGRDALHLGLASPGLLEPNPKRRVDEGSVLLGATEVPVGRLFAAVLARAVTEAAAAADGPLTDVVVTCPASWGAQRRKVLLDAAPPHTRLVAEPVAAAHYFADVAGHRVPVGATALVYDFGAGTFDASVVRRTEQGFELLATLGLDDTGGLDIDAALFEHLHGSVADPEGYWPRFTNPADASDRRMAHQLWDNVRTAKEMLSRLPATQVHLPLFNTEVALERSTLETLAAPVLQRTVGTSVEVLTVAGQPIQALAAVFLAGGSSRMPAVAAALQQALGIAPAVVLQPELAVAEGSLGGFDTPEAAPAAADFSSTGAHPLVPDPSPPLSPPPLPITAPPAPRAARRGLVVAGAVVLAVLVLAGGGTALAMSLRADRPGRTPVAPLVLPSASSLAASPSTAPSASPAVRVAAGRDPCLVGTWRQTSSEIQINHGSTKHQYSGGAGILQSYDGAGRTVYDAENSAPYKATVDGANWEETTRGVVRGNYRILDGAVVLSGLAGETNWVLTRNGKRNNSGKGTLGLKPERYLCEGDHLIQYGPDGDYTNELARIGPPTP
jgi:hypothetical protein